MVLGLNVDDAFFSRLLRMTTGRIMPPGVIDQGVGPPWTVEYDPNNGRPYYYNTQTGTVSWTKPGEQWSLSYDNVSNQQYWIDAQGNTKPLQPPTVASGSRPATPRGGGSTTPRLTPRSSIPDWFSQNKDSLLSAKSMQPKNQYAAEEEMRFQQQLLFQQNPNLIPGMGVGTPRNNHRPDPYLYTPEDAMVGHGYNGGQHSVSDSVVSSAMVPRNTTPRKSRVSPTGSNSIADSLQSPIVQNGPPALRLSSNLTTTSSVSHSRSYNLPPGNLRGEGENAGPLSGATTPQRGPSPQGVASIGKTIMSPEVDGAAGEDVISYSRSQSRSVVELLLNGRQTVNDNDGAASEVVTTPRGSTSINQNYSPRYEKVGTPRQSTPRGGISRNYASSAGVVPRIQNLNGTPIHNRNSNQQAPSAAAIQNFRSASMVSPRNSASSTTGGGGSYHYNNGSSVLVSPRYSSSTHATSTKDSSSGAPASYASSASLQQEQRTNDPYGTSSSTVAPTTTTSTHHLQEQQHDPYATSAAAQGSSSNDPYAAAPVSPTAASNDPYAYNNSAVDERQEEQHQQQQQYYGTSAGGGSQSSTYYNSSTYHQGGASSGQHHQQEQYNSYEQQNYSQYPPGYNNLPENYDHYQQQQQRSDYHSRQQDYYGNSYPPPLPTEQGYHAGMVQPRPFAGGPGHQAPGPGGQLPPGGPGPPPASPQYMNNHQHQLPPQPVQPQPRIPLSQVNMSAAANLRTGGNSSTSMMHQNLAMHQRNNLQLQAQYYAPAQPLFAEPQFHPGYGMRGGGGGPVHPGAGGGPPGGGSDRVMPVYNQSRAPQPSLQQMDFAADHEMMHGLEEMIRDPRVARERDFSPDERDKIKRWVRKAQEFKGQIVEALADYFSDSNPNDIPTPQISGAATFADMYDQGGSHNQNAAQHRYELPDDRSGGADQDKSNLRVKIESSLEFLFSRFLSGKKESDPALPGAEYAYNRGRAPPDPFP
ncbi:unnamed protein product [Amoebophrya sp. A120]|nr:unnamed protein product [Amoebophrya sp. A120]|eukprot:GSA120T00008265001.1